MSEFEWVQSFATSSYGTVGFNTSAEGHDALSESKPPSRGSFASFVCHVANLENKLRSFSPVVLDGSSRIVLTPKILGQGTTFMARHARWHQDPKQPPVDVALKEIIPATLPSESPAGSNSSESKSQTDWKDILFELRALLHEPIRYHPNIVRLLGIQWGLSALSDSTYPVLVMEFASLGTFNALQATSEPLPFQVKQKLCYDVGRGLTALHACGIVHGDMKHENVLIFPCQNSSHGIKYTAKLADFGGSVMDMRSYDLRRVETGTWPFQAPEVASGQPLTRKGMMLADVYSFGLLIWRAFLDGDGFVSLPGARSSDPELDRRSMNERKASDEMTSTAIIDILNYARGRGIAQSSVDMMIYIFIHTLQVAPEDRDLNKAQAALRGLKPGHVPRFLSFVQGKNEKRDAQDANAAPGRHGITMDSLSFMLGRYGNDVDIQDNLPGYRPSLDEPNPEEFLFEPEKLKKILTWEQQVQMLSELKDRASDTRQSHDGLLEMKPTVAAFYVFQCNLLEFGTAFNAQEAVAWLLRSSSDDDSHEDADYLAQAWLWRVSQALGMPHGLSADRLRSLLTLSVVRGHHTCLQDMLRLAVSGDAAGRQQWSTTYQDFRRILLTQFGAVGMGYYFPKFLRSPWNPSVLSDIIALDSAVREVLGNNYQDCLKVSITTGSESNNDDETAFDRIYINQRGHRLLHYAAAMDSVVSLRHMIATYRCNIDAPNQHVDETPLVSACVGGKLGSALVLLDHGANPDGYRFGQEGPLHWLCSFVPDEMKTIATRLVAAGADVELRSGGMRHDVRGIRADWEHVFEIPTTPLGRAVVMNSFEAVKLLLDLGADPLAKHANNHRGAYEGADFMSKVTNAVTPFELAAVLTRPLMLAEFIKHIDAKNGSSQQRLLDEMGMLNLAHEKKLTTFDPLSLQSRLVRCGDQYKIDLRGTMLLLFQRAQLFHKINSDQLDKDRSQALCTEVELGNVDIVQCLLELGYPANGTDGFRPLEKAVELNHEELFYLLMQFKADPTITRMTPTGRISLLHIAASRPRQSRPGRLITDALITANVPVGSVDPRSRPPLATAILNQNFDVAQALLEKGANVDATYPLNLAASTELEQKNVSVFVELLSQHTMRTLVALQFLFSRGKEHLPAFLVDPNNDFSILHLLAGSDQFTQIAQITPRILSLCLDAYSDPLFINHRHSLLGTPLYYAAACGNKVMVEGLLNRGADRSHNAGPIADNSVQLILWPQACWAPLWAAIIRLDEELNIALSQKSAETHGAWLKSNLVQNLEKIIAALLPGSVDGVLAQALEALRKRKARIQTAFGDLQAAKEAQRRQVKSGHEVSPIDLSILSAEGRKDDTDAIEEICRGPEQDWKDGGIEWLLKSLEATSLQ